MIILKLISSQKILRKEGDSNPRYVFDVYTLSRRASSATRAPVLETTSYKTGASYKKFAIRTPISGKSNFFFQTNEIFSKKGTLEMLKNAVSFYTREYHIEN